MSAPSRDPQPSGLGQLPPTPPAAGKNRRSGRLAGAVLVLGVLIVGLGACAVDSSGATGRPAAPVAINTPRVTSPAKATPAPTVRVTKTAKAGAPPAENVSAISDAQYLVGTEITTGTWKSSASDGPCYADTQTKAGRVLEQAGSSGKPSIIRIRRGAYTFTSRGCGNWNRID